MTTPYQAKEKEIEFLRAHKKLKEKQTCVTNGDMVKECNLSLRDIVDIGCKMAVCRNQSNFKKEK